VSIEVPDLAAAKVFYGEMLDLGSPVYDIADNGWIEFATGSDAGNLAITQAKPGWQPSHTTTIVLNTEDCHGACGELTARGVRCEELVTFPGYVTFCSFYDPFGNRLQMASPAP
jgi:predicted enzyme related to lactoylglutathione lyase